jgi:hypothetical protein
MSSRGEMKISLSEITCYTSETIQFNTPEVWKLTFSCLRCFKSFNSLYVLFDKTGVLKGFMIFLTATFCPVS